ncbi:hypothetical protein [Streptomyces sp. NPDC048445]|uniref:hypothetical protein n=1 Tax=Streptomyces sp. NPDC048445 TaxID=3365553 RepID=UPI00371BFBB8
MTNVRGFRLHLSHGRVLDGAQFPNGRVVVMDDPEWGLCSGARDAELLTIGYPDARIEWADGSEPLDENRAEPAHLVHPSTEQQAGEPTGVDEPALPPEQPCTNPRHTGAIRERLGCSGPDPATT